MKRMLCLLTACLTALLLCGCAQSGVPVAPNEPTATLPPASAEGVAPIGDASLEYTASATLFLPRHDGTRLVAISGDVTFSFARPVAESIVRALCNHPGDGMVRALGGDVRLSLYGANPVEVSHNVATVNLSATALQLDRPSLYLAGQAIANTLCELSTIDYVNLLVMNNPVSLDIAGTLPMGTFSRSIGQDTGAVYEQLLSRRASANENPAEKQLSANATLYFPIEGTSGFMSEVRACSFASQEFPDMVMTLLRELAAGPQQGLRSPALPLMADLLTAQPAISEAGQTGGRTVSLAFAYNFDEMLEAYGLTRAQSLASICYTLCTFLPNITGLSVSIGETPVTTLMLTESFESSVDFEASVMRRPDFSALLYDECTLYFTDGHQLVASRRPIPYYQRSNPRFLLIELGKGPLGGDSVGGLLPVMPLGAISDADVLGLAVAQGEMLVNFAPSFEKLGEELDAQGERTLAYAMVNTLLKDERVNSVQFFLSGSQWDSFTGEVYWRGAFTPMY